MRLKLKFQSTFIDKKIISIKGKSNEGIGFIGRKEGIAVLTNTTIKISDNKKKVIGYKF